MSEGVLFYPELVDARDYPRPRVPMLAQLSLKHWFGGGRAGNKSAFQKDGLFFVQGRYAFEYALKATGVVAGSRVLMPAYHCRSLVEPAVYLGADVVFYSLKKDLSPDLDVLVGLLTSAGSSIKAMILPHYFGFPQAAENIANLCDAHDVALIEDCAHSFYGTLSGNALGTFGRFAVASPRKFFPIEDGGILLSNEEGCSSLHSLVPQPLVDEVKSLGRAAINLFRSFKSSKTPKFDVVEEDFMEGVFEAGTSGVELETGLKWYIPGREKQAGLGVSRWIMNAAAHDWIIASRRKNYDMWLRGVAHLDRCYPLYPQLENDVVPYVFPLVIENQSQLVFQRLKLLGMPMWRWEEMAVTNCDVSKKYRVSLIQLPCHQELSNAQLSWMIEALKKVMNTV